MKLKKGLSALLLGITLLLGSCGPVQTERGVGMDYYDNLTKGQVYNKNLWYQNDLDEVIADPEIIYVDYTGNKDVDGYYYMYGTSSGIGAAGFSVWRSKQLNHWELMPPCFIPARDSWALTSLWAPEVHYVNGKFYLYYSGANYQSGKRLMGISVAVSDSPLGPFKEFEGKDATGKEFTRSNQVFDFGFPAIDATYFQDEDGTGYMYIAKDQVNKESNIWGVKMLDPVTPDYSTLKLLARPGKSQPNLLEDDIAWEIVDARGNRWNEAPFMIKHNGKYILTYSSNPFWTVAYGVGYALSDSPLGDFVKPNQHLNQNLLLGVDPYDQGSNWNFMSGTGHHCFFYAGDELMIGYHAHQDREFGSSTRAFAMDHVQFNDEDIIYANGPTWSLQPLPSSVSGYKNIALEAKISVTNGGDPKLLQDGKFPMHYNSAHQAAFDFKSNGTTTITFDFEEERTIRAVEVINSLGYETMIKKIQRIDFGNNRAIFNLGFNSDYYSDDDEFIRPGSPLVAEFNELKTKSVSITIEMDKEFTLGEVFILGK